eukprot:TRINITY_DN63702_c0_g1_i1.p1 TRINITY_DN63702_c0_g1~~TRINITY_DN63702_c0_g1_i1.p1  ORF type:complete len:339 (-),score=38.21 TRINITY_DN63702_c0_g1_i1:68-1045(-)
MQTETFDDAEDARAVSKADRRLFFVAALGHGSARVLSKFVSAPLERIKVCLQVSSCTRKPDGLRLFRDIVEGQGVRSLWRGSTPHIGGICLGAVVRLSALRTSQMYAMPGGGQQYHGIEAYVRNCTFLYVASAAALTVAYPFDVAYTCLATDVAPPLRFRGISHFVRHSVREHGVTSLYRGYPLCLATAVPFVAVATATHDVLAPRLMQRMGQPPVVGHGTAWATLHLYPWNLLVGAAAGFIAQSTTYPLDTIRRCWEQTCASSRPAGVRRWRSGGWRACARQIYARGGWRAFYAGYAVNALKLGPELLVLCTAYQTMNESGTFV